MTALPHKSDLSPSLFSPLASKLLLACFVSIDFLHEFYCLPGIFGDITSPFLVQNKTAEKNNTCIKSRAETS